MVVFLKGMVQIAKEVTPAANSNLSPISPTGVPHAAADSNTIATVLSIVFGIVGALALLMITISGLRYIIAAGDPQRTAQAKNGIIYSLVGLAIALAAEAIVAFVVNQI